MNKSRRAAINALITKLESLQEDLQNLRDEEQEYLDNMPESLQYGEKGEKSQEAIDALDYADTNISDAIDNLNEAAGED